MMTANTRSVEGSMSAQVDPDEDESSQVPPNSRELSESRMTRFRMAMVMKEMMTLIIMKAFVSTIPCK